MITTVQILTLYTDPERHNVQRYRRTDGRHYTMMPIADCTALVLISKSKLKCVITGILALPVGVQTSQLSAVHRTLHNQKRRL